MRLVDDESNGTCEHQNNDIEIVYRISDLFDTLFLCRKEILGRRKSS